MIYRKLPTAIAMKVMDRCDQLNVHYHVWNAAESIFGIIDTTELGMAERDWEQMADLL